MTILNFAQFLLWERASRDRVSFKKSYADLAGDVLAGLVLSEIVYWYLPSEDGASKLRVEHDGHYWIACRRYEWWDRTRLSPKQADRALNILIDAGLIVKKVYKFDGEPTVHVRLLTDVFMERWHKLVENPPTNPFFPNGKNEIPESAKTKSPIGNNDLPDSETPVTPLTASPTPSLVSTPPASTPNSDSQGTPPPARPRQIPRDGVPRPAESTDGSKIQGQAFAAHPLGPILVPLTTRMGSYLTRREVEKLAVESLTIYHPDTQQPVALDGPVKTMQGPLREAFLEFIHDRAEAGKAVFHGKPPSMSWLVDILCNYTSAKGWGNWVIEHGLLEKLQRGGGSTLYTLRQDFE